jgi:hypothetical protein
MKARAGSGFGRVGAGILGISLSVAAPVLAEIDLPQIPAPEEAAERLRQCGFESVAATFDDLLQEDVLTVSEIKTASDEQIACGARVSIETHYYLSLPDDLQERYWAAYWPLSEERGRETSRDWLSDRGLLGRVPKYDPLVTDDAAYARQLEKLCGPVADGALGSEYGPHSISPTWAEDRQDDFEGMGTAAVCLINAGAISGFKIYLIGNEKAREPQ